MTRRSVRMAKPAMDFLCARYPRCFNVDNPQPLKIGIQHDIRDQLPLEISRNAIANALEWYSRRLEYLNTVIEGHVRIDLDGESLRRTRPKTAMKD